MKDVLKGRLSAAAAAASLAGAILPIEQAKGRAHLHDKCSTDALSCPLA